MFKTAALVGFILVMSFFVSAQNKDYEWLNGTWEGTAYQIDSDTIWTMRLTASGGRYAIEYPTLKCGGSWRIVSLSLERATFIERINHGRDKCVDDGNLIIERLNAEQILFRWTLPDSLEVMATAVLKRKLPLKK